MIPVRLQRYGPDYDWDRHFADTFALAGSECLLCHELAFEAWERMTDGGVRPTYYAKGCLPKSGPVRRNMSYENVPRWVAYVTR